MRRFLPTVVGALVLIVVAGFWLQINVFAQPRLKDLSGNWAAEHITALVEKGVLHGYPDNTFRPNKAITRAEFAKIMVKAFTVPSASDQPFRDMNKHWAAADVAALCKAQLIKGYEDGSFRPDRPITRAEVVAIIIRTLKLEDASQAVDNTSDSVFADLPNDHWASSYVEAANRLDILPPYFKGRFRPTEEATRAEIAAMVNETLRLQVAKGVIDFIDSDQYQLSVKTEQNTLRDYSLPPTTTIYRNVGIVDAKQLRKNDDVYVVADRFGTPIFLKANGLITQDDVVTKVSNVTKGLLTPEQLKAAIRGDWTSVAEGFQVTLYNQLLDFGATPMEADSIMQKDWASVQGLARERLTKALGASLNLSDELVIAVMDQDWVKARELAQSQALQSLLSRLLLG